MSFVELSPATPQTGFISVTGNIGTPNTDGVLKLFNVCDFGATGTGGVDDSAAILSALSAATSFASANNLGTCLFFPPGKYIYESATPINLQVGVTVWGAGDCEIIGIGASTTSCFVFTSTVASSNAQAGITLLPAVRGFSQGVGVLIQYQLATVHCSQISNCASGLQLYTQGGANVINNTINVGFIQSCVYGVVVAGDTGGGVLQGNNVNVNFVSACTHAFTVVATGGATSVTCNVNQFNLYGIDLAGGGGSSTICFYSPSGVSFEGFTLRATNYCVPDVGGTFFSMPGASELTVVLYVPSPPPWSNFGFAGSNSILSFVQAPNGSNTWGNVTSPTPLVTTSNSRSSFDGGVMPVCNTMVVSATLPAALSSGQTADFYGYHPACTNNTMIRYSLRTSAAVTIIAAEDETGVAGVDGQGPIADQFHIRLLALSNISAGTVIVMWLDLGDARGS